MSTWASSAVRRFEVVDFSLDESTVGRGRSSSCRSSSVIQAKTQAIHARLSRCHHPSELLCLAFRAF